jgi:hypothetical protein
MAWFDQKVCIRSTQHGDVEAEILGADEGWGLIGVNTAP